MKRLLLLSLSLLCAHVYGQDVVFNTHSWDFGTLKEADGNVTYDFSFRNNGPDPVRIGSVSVSCSCVSAQFPHKDIPSGGTGTITLEFSPAGGAGKTHRYADVYTREGKYLGRLSMVADVIPADTALEERYYTVVEGPLRARRLSVNFGYVREGITVAKEVYLANVSDQPLTLEVLPGALKVEAPSQIPPKGEAVLKVLYRPSGAYYTFQQDVQLRVNGQPSRRSIPVSAICLGPGKEKSGASLWTLPSEGTLKRGRGSIELGNNGTEDLLVLGVEVPDGVQVNLSAGTRIGPGKKQQVKVSSTLPSFEIHLFTNDPTRPYKELRFK